MAGGNPASIRSMRLAMGSEAARILALVPSTSSKQNCVQKVQPEVAKFACVAAYDRAGLGMSDPAVTEPRTTAQIAREFARLRA